MAIYKFKGIDLDGKKISRELNASDPNELKAMLKARGITVLSFKETKEKRRSNFLAVSSKVKPQEFVSFCQQFSIMLDSGASIGDTLEVLRKQNFGTVFKNTISKVYESVLSGKYLSEALSEHKKIFPKYFISLVSVGEMSGSLAETLRKASIYYDNDVKVKKRVRSALIYPSFLFVVTIAVSLFLMYFVVPTFEEILIEFNGTVPFITQMVSDVSHFMIDNVLYIVLVLLILVIIIYIINKTKWGQYLKAMLAFNLPIIKNVNRNLIASRFSLSFGILVESGMSVVDAMKQLSDIMNNPYFTKKFLPVLEDVNKGKRIYRSMENVKIFPPALIQVIKVGEETSTIDKVCKVMGNYYQEELNTAITRATSLLEPIVIIIMGAIVGIVVLAVLLPMLEMNTTIGGNV